MSNRYNKDNGGENWIIYLIVPFILGAIFIYGCLDGGSGGSASPPPPPPPSDNSHLLAWIQEPFYEDNTAMDITQDVKMYEIYVHNSALLPSSAEPVAYVAGMHSHDNLALHVADHFDLGLLREFGVDADNSVKWVFMRTESQDNVASQFSQPHQWGVLTFNMEVTPQ